MKEKLLRPAFTCCISALLLSFATGCPRFSTKLTYSLGTGDIRRINIDAPASDQTVKVTVSSPTTAVSVYVVLDENAKQVEDSLTLQKAPDRNLLLASADVRQEGVVEAKVPKRKGYSVFIVGTGKSAEISVTISGS